jgi:hypothetical protein
MGVYLLWKGLLERFFGSLIHGQTTIIMHQGYRHMQLRLWGIFLIAAGFALQGISALLTS